MSHESQVSNGFANCRPLTRSGRRLLRLGLLDFAAGLNCADADDSSPDVAGHEVR